MRTKVLATTIAILQLGILASCGSTTDEATSETTPESTGDTTSAAETDTAGGLAYPIVDSAQIVCYDDTDEIECPDVGEPFAGQDAQFTENSPVYTDNGDGTVTDEVTGLVWTQSTDSDGDGDIGASDKLSFEASAAYCDALSLGDYDDWTVPAIKQLYSLMNFTGVDPSSIEDDDTSGLTPFIDSDVFDYAYGDTDANERVVDSQYVSSNLYVGNDGSSAFGVNFADGRIKGYELDFFQGDKTFFVQCVRENDTYGINDFTDNGDNTVTDAATGLTWTQDDSGGDVPDGMNWEEALAYVETRNEANYLGYSDWRLPSVKELQGIVDYTRSPDTTDSAAIDPIFNTTVITNEAGDDDYAFYWSSTTHASSSDPSGTAGAYVAFGRSLGYTDGEWVDVHGAGSQRSDPKIGDPDDYPTGYGPQGDAIRIYNMARLVRS